MPSIKKLYRKLGGLKRRQALANRQIQALQARLKRILNTRSKR